jgi:hypothetical protein
LVADACVVGDSGDLEGSSDFEEFTSGDPEDPRLVGGTGLCGAKER